MPIGMAKATMPGRTMNAEMARRSICLPTATLDSLRSRATTPAAFRPPSEDSCKLPDPGNDPPPLAQVPVVAIAPIVAICNLNVRGNSHRRHPCKWIVPDRAFLSTTPNADPCRAPPGTSVAIWCAGRKVAAEGPPLVDGTGDGCTGQEPGAIGAEIGMPGRNFPDPVGIEE